MIGNATLYAYKVGARVSMFYKAVGLLFVSFFVFNLIAYYISKTKFSFLSFIETKIINYISFSAIILLLIKMLGCEISGTMALVYLLHKVMFSAILIRLFIFKKTPLTLYNYTFLLLLTLSVNFLVLDCMAPSVENGQRPNFFLPAFIIGCLLIVLFNVFLNNGRGLKSSRVEESMYALLPLAFLPFVSVLKDEIFLVLKARHFHLGNSLTIYFVLLLLVAGWIMLRRTSYKKKERISQRKMIALKYFPAFVFSVVAYAQYSHFITFTGEVFEGGNRFLPVMEFKMSGVVPTLEKFNSHLLSDYFFPALYTILNGHVGYDMILYDFLYIALSYVLYYYLIFYISRNAFLALFCVIFFPFCTSLLPELYSFGILVFFAMQKLFSKKQSLKTYIAFFGSVAGVLIWRVDIGVTIIPEVIVLLVYYHLISKNFRINPVMLVKGALVIVGAVGLVIAFLCLYRHTNLLNNVPAIINFLSSAQTYGYPNLGQEDLAIYKLHYYIFPPLVAIIVLALLLNFRSLNKSRNQQYAYLALLFTSIYYLANFNRGLVRHGLIELVDHYTSTYIYIILPGAFLVFFRNQNQIVKYACFFVISVLLLTNYKMPVIVTKTANSFFEKIIKNGDEAKPKLAKIENRVIFPEWYKNDNDSAAIKFILANTKPDETFIDFSNHPMMYFYTQKATPSFFYQNPICSHNDFLQDRFISDLQDYKTPYMLFARTDNKVWDIVDGVPNTLRHYKIAEHLFQNYKPYVLAGFFNVWKANNTQPAANKIDTIYRFTRNADPTAPVFTLQTELAFKPGKRYMAKYILANPVNLTLKATFSNNDTVSIRPEFITENLAYSIIDSKGDRAIVELKNLYDQIINFYILECDYVPDLTFEKFQAFDFSLVPYIWGTYDKKVKVEPILFDAPTAVQLTANTPQVFKIPTNIDRTSGNTLLVNCTNQTGAIQKITVSFGSDKEKLRTKIDFIVIPSGKDETYAIRLSSAYKWYTGNVNELSLSTQTDGLITSRINITKGL
jgi:hypothetical protein